ncbi:hypothetical protein B566_EDAN017251 [Ephemera danica]|nr:hypothetical protein B566_EDAN017251 [Ephemera danica]
MGAEQSAQNQPTRSRSLNRPQKVAQESVDLNDEARSASPGPSVCSDSDLPYISYTVNRPIGDSPKLQQKLQHRGKPAPRGRHPLLGSRSQQRGRSAPPSKAHNIVVVKPAVESNDLETDEDQLRLRQTPMFLPIMRGTLNLPAARDPEVLERLDPGGLLALGTRYQHHLAACAELVASEQNQLGARIRELAEKLSKVHEVSAQLNRCHSLLNQTLESMETLNNLLPLEERLEPFVWTTGL